MKRRFYSVAIVLLLPACNYVEQAKQAASGPAPAAQPVAPAPVAEPAAVPEPTPQPMPEPTPESAKPALPEKPALDPIVWAEMHAKLALIAHEVDGFAFDKFTTGDPAGFLRDLEKDITKLEAQLPILVPAGNALREMMVWVHPDKVAKIKPQVRLRSYETAKKAFQAAFAEAAPPKADEIKPEEK